MANTDEKIVLGLNIPKSKAQINADIKKLEKQLAQVKATGALDTNSTVKQLNSQIAALQSQLKSLNIKANIDTTDVSNAAKQTGSSVAQSISDGIRQSGGKVNTEIENVVTKAAASARQAINFFEELETFKNVGMAESY